MSYSQAFCIKDQVNPHLWLVYAILEMGFEISLFCSKSFLHPPLPVQNFYKIVNSDVLNEKTNQILDEQNLQE